MLKHVNEKPSIAVSTCDSIALFSKSTVTNVSHWNLSNVSGHNLYGCVLYNSIKVDQKITTSAEENPTVIYLIKQYNNF